MTWSVGIEARLTRLESARTSIVEHAGFTFDPKAAVEAIERLENAVRALEQRAFPPMRVAGPSGGTDSLADRIRDGWSRGYHLIGLTDGPDPSAVWDVHPIAPGKRALIQASEEFDSLAGRVMALDCTIDDSKERRDIVTTMHDCAAFYRKAAREVR